MTGWEEGLNFEQHAWRLSMGRGLHKIPAHMREAIHHWVMFGEQRGGFLMALLANNLKHAVFSADEMNLAVLGDWVRFLANDCPSHCWGSQEAVADWMAHGGLSRVSPQPAAAAQVPA